MLGDWHVWFLGEAVAVTSQPYPTPEFIMTTHNSKSGAALTQNNSSAQKNTNQQAPNPPTITYPEIYDDFNELQCLNYFLYDAVEALHDQPEESLHHQTSHMGLMILLRYLRSRTENAMSNLEQLNPKGAHEAAL
jgi:hypothetical protein